MQGQFPCPECGQPIRIMIHRKGDVARCLSCGARVEVPEALEEAKPISDENEVEKACANLAPMYSSLVRECQNIPGVRLHLGTQVWSLSYNAQDSSQFWIDLLLDSESPEITVATGSGGDHTHLGYYFDDNPESAVDCFRRGLSGRMRVVASVGSGGDIYHDVELLVGEEWKHIAGGRGCFPWFRPKVVGTRVLINHVLPPPSPEVL